MPFQVGGATSNAPQSQVDLHLEDPNPGGPQVPQLAPGDMQFAFGPGIPPLSTLNNPVLPEYPLRGMQTEAVMPEYPTRGMQTDMSYHDSHVFSLGGGIINPVVPEYPFRGMQTDVPHPNSQHIFSLHSGIINPVVPEFPVTGMQTEAVLPEFPLRGMQTEMPQHNAHWAHVLSLGGSVIEPAFPHKGDQAEVPHPNAFHLVSFWVV